jgi:NADH-quinone oxidoreductase subunit H
MVTLYFGGYNFPGMHSLHVSPNLLTIFGVIAFFIKIFIFLFFFIWVRWTVPRFRYDQLMKLGWKMLIPLALLNLLATGAIMLYIGH